MVELKRTFKGKDELREELNLLHEAEEIKKKYNELLLRIENETIMVVTDLKARTGIAIPLSEAFDQEAYQGQGLVRYVDPSKTLKTKLGGDWAYFTGTTESI